MAKIKYYFDFLSPYSYLSWQWVKELENVEYIPVPLATIIHSYETKGPAEIAPKRDYLLKQCLRYAKKNKINFVKPHSLPFNSLLALRAATKECSADKHKEIIDLCFKLSWARGLDIGDEKVLLDAGISQKLIDRAFERDVKKALKQNVRNALEDKVFGVPTLIYNNELFWGNDSKEDFLNYLNSKDCLDPSLYASFQIEDFQSTSF